MFEKLSRFLESNVSHVVNELDSGYLFELFAEVRRIDPGDVRDLRQSKMFAAVFFDEFSCFPNVTRLGAMSAMHDRSSFLEAAFQCFF